MFIKSGFQNCNNEIFFLNDEICVKILHIQPLHASKISQLWEKSGADPENQKEVASTLASCIDTIHFTDTCNSTKIIQDFTEEGVATVLMANPQLLFMKNGLSSKQKHKKTQKSILSERYGDPYRRLEDFYHYSAGRLQDKLREYGKFECKICWIRKIIFALTIPRKY